ncbi:MAG: PKD domain-containing protein, partial [Rhodoferax sp.]
MTNLKGQMNVFRAAAFSLALGALLAACGGGGSGSSSGGDVIPGSKPVVDAFEPNSFLLFPNPHKQSDGTLEVNSLAYATAYYEAIDPSNERATLAGFKAKNGIGSGSGGGAIEENIIVGDMRDLGYGRKMTARQNADGTLAFMVENYLAGGYGGYSSFNLEAAMVGATQWHVGTNGIEFSPGPGGAVNFVKFYTFDPVTGARLMAANLDGRGTKAMPTICISCHGGRGDPLTPPDTGGKRLFAKVMNLVSQARGDVGAQLHPFEPAALDFPTDNKYLQYTRAQQEAKIKNINKMVLCSVPLPAGTVAALPEDTCRRVATVNEYQGTVAEHLKDMYGGDGLPLAATKASDTYVPTNWANVGQSTLYLNTQAQACRVCHLLRGTGNQSDISFDTFAKFDGYADRIKTHVIDRGNMPLAELIYDKFWSTPAINGTLATFLAGKGYADSSARPGRPISDPGPSRVIKQMSTTLSAAMSLYATNYQWSIVSGPTGATLSSATSAQPVFTATSAGSYVISLVASRAGQTGTAAQFTLVVNPALGFDPQALRFTDIKSVLQTGGGGCTTCHQLGGNGTVTPPIWYTSYDRATTGNGADATNDRWFYTELRGRINFTDLASS